jgi:hypothetical protein
MYGEAVYRIGLYCSKHAMTNFTYDLDHECPVCGKN